MLHRAISGGGNEKTRPSDCSGDGDLVTVFCDMWLILVEFCHVDTPSLKYLVLHILRTHINIARGVFSIAAVFNGEL